MGGGGGGGGGVGVRPPTRKIVSDADFFPWHLIPGQVRKEENIQECALT